MSRNARFHGFALVFALLIARRAAAADAAGSATRRILFTVDHETGKVVYDDQTCPAGCPIVERSSWTSGPNGAVPITNDKATLSTRVPIVFEVAHTNTALYSYTFGVKKFDAEEIATLKSFTKGLGGYLLDALGRFFPTKPASEAAPETAIDPVRDDLKKVHGAVVSLLGTEATVVRNLERMVTLKDAAPAVSLPDIRASLRTELKSRFVLRPGKDGDADWEGHLKACSELSEGLESLAKDLAKAEDQADLVQDKTARDAAQGVIDAAKKVLENSGELLDRAYAVQRLALLAVNARDTWFSEPFTLSLAAGRDVKLTVAPRKIAAITRLLPAETLEVAVKLSPDWLLRPAVGLSLLMSTGSSFPQYAAVKDSSGIFHVADAGRSDQRFTYGLSLGLTPRWLDHRDHGGWAVWIPELTVNPSSDVKAVAVGAGFSFFKIVKLGAGFLWTRHKALDGQSVGDALADEKALKTRDAYGSPHGYVGLSIIGWPPFVKE